MSGLYLRRKNKTNMQQETENQTWSEQRLAKVGVARSSSPNQSTSWDWSGELVHATTASTWRCSGLILRPLPHLLFVLSSFFHCNIQLLPFQRLFVYMHECKAPGPLPYKALLLCRV